VILSYGIEEAKGLGKQSRRHTWPEGEDHESGEVAQGHGASGQSKVIVRWCGVIPPRKKARTIESAGREAHEGEKAGRTQPFPEYGPESRIG